MSEDLFYTPVFMAPCDIAKAIIKFLNMDTEILALADLWLSLVPKDTANPGNGGYKLSLEDRKALKVYFYFVLTEEWISENGGVRGIYQAIYSRICEGDNLKPKASTWY